MKALTLTQPWATLVAVGAKRIETRSWRTPYRGRIAIHAAKALPVSFRGLEKHFEVAGCVRGPDGYFSGAQLPRGAVVATARLVNCVPTDYPGMEQDLEQWGAAHDYLFGDYSPGRWAWLLADIQKLEAAIPARGSLGLWEWSIHNPPNPVQLAGVG